MYCSKCGVQNTDQTAQCANCGNELTDGAQQVAEQSIPVMAVESKNSRLAIASMIMGLLCITCILWPVLALPAIICGIVALVKISNNKAQLKGKGFAITGIVVPIVLMVLLLPVLIKVKNLAQSLVCSVNLKGLSCAMVVYANDYDDTLPTENWCDLLIEETDVSPKSFICPGSDAIEGESSYAMNKHIAGKKLNTLPGDVVLLFETDMGRETVSRKDSIQKRMHYEFLKEYRDGVNAYNEKQKVYIDRFNQFGGPEDLLIGHTMNARGCNVTFADGGCAFITEDRIGDLKWTVE